MENLDTQISIERDLVTDKGHAHLIRLFELILSETDPLSSMTWELKKLQLQNLLR